MSEQPQNSTPILSLKKSDRPKSQSKKKADDSDKILPSEVEDQLIRFLRNEPPRFSDWAKVPRMDVEYQIVRSVNGGTGLILAIKDNTATILDPATAAEILRKFVMDLPPQFAAYYIDGTKAIKVIKSFVATKPHLEALPKSVGFKSDPELVLNRLSFDPAPVTAMDLDDCAPLFAKMLARTNNWEALLARIGSIFDPQADRKQAVWVYGPPDCGKSQYAFLLQKLCPNFAILGTSDQDTAYFKAMLLGNRLGLVMEAGARFIRSEEFKATTGDGTHAINQKYQPIFNAPLDILYFCFSNQGPEIPNDESLRVRVIACKVDTIPSSEIRYGEKEFQALLEKELPYIAGAALDTYKSLVKPGNRIPCSMDDLTDSIDNFEEEYLDILENHVVNTPGHKTTFREMTRFFEFVGLRSNLDKARIKRVLENRYKVTKRKLCVKNSGNYIKRVSVWDGVRLIDIPEQIRETITFIDD